MTQRATARTAAPSTTRGATGTRGATATRPSTTTSRSGPRSAPQPVAARPELRLVPAATPARPRRRIRSGLGSGRAPFVLLVVAMLVATTVALLILNTGIAVDSLKATELRAANAERAQQVQRLEQQVVSAGTPARVAAAAVAAGLVPAGSAAFLVVAPDGSSTLRGMPEPAEAPPAPVPPASSPAVLSPVAPGPVGTPGGG